MIELKGVTKQYLYGARVLGSCELKVDDGEIVAVVGGAGSGKTTLLKVVAGVTDCEGSVLVNGNPIDKKPDDVLMVFDDLAVFKNRSFYYNLAYPLKIRGVDKNEIDVKVKDAAGLMGITACLYEKVKNMPYIDVKRLGIARLFLREYKALLIDDITDGLTRQEAEELWAEVAPVILKKAKEGVSVIFATQSISEARSIADRIAFMNCGEIKAVATYDEIYQNPSNIWAAQAVDKYYHFERARLERNDGKLEAVLGVKTPVSEENEIKIDAGALDGKIAGGYEGKEVFIGWHACDFCEEGERCEDVEYAIREDDAYILHTSSGVLVKSKVKKDSVCTLPDIKKARIFDFASENSLHISD